MPTPPDPSPIEHQPLIDAFGNAVPIQAPQFHKTPREPFVDFDYEEVERQLEANPQPEEPTTELSPETDLQKFQRVLRWIDGGASSNMDGVAIRAKIVCWVGLPEMQPMTLTELARSCGKFKQSFGRHVTDLKKEIPGVKTSHMCFK